MEFLKTFYIQMKSEMMLHLVMVFRENRKLLLDITEPLCELPSVFLALS